MAKVAVVKKSCDLAAERGQLAEGSIYLLYTRVATIYVDVICVYLIVSLCMWV